MLPPFSIVCAWKDLGCPHRRRAFEFTRAYWTHHFPEAEQVVAAPEPFTKARGLNEAVVGAACDLIVHSDPDSVVPAPQIVAAVRLAGEADGLVVPYSTYLYLGELATERLHGSPLGQYPVVEKADCQFFGSGGCGPATVYSRATWEKARGYDERFGLWGGDDVAFAHACDAFCEAEVRKVGGPVYHSYHPRLPQSEPGGPGYSEQFAILAGYAAAARVSREAVRALVETRGLRDPDREGGYC